MTTSPQTNGWDFATRMGQTIAIAAVVSILGWAYINQPKVDGGGDSDDKPIVVEPISVVLARAYDSDRKSKIAILKGVAENKFPTDKAKLEWINSESQKRLEVDFKEFTDRFGVAVKENTTAEMAKALEAGK